MTHDELLVKEELEQVFYYDESSPSCLRWNVWNGATNHNKRVKDDVAGWLTPKGYFRVKYKSKNVAVHRIILVLKNLDVSNKLVDHIDGDKSKNKIENLRLVSELENAKNCKRYKNNTTGLGNVTLKSNGRNSFYYTVQFYDESGNRKTVNFSVDEHGWEGAEKLAKSYREAIFSIFVEKGIYTERHGKEEK